MTKHHWVYDLETIQNCFIAVFESYIESTRKVFIVHTLKNDLPQLIEFLLECKKEKCWFFGYNNIAFDAQIIQHILKNKLSQPLDQSTSTFQVEKYFIVKN